MSSRENTPSPSQESSESQLIADVVDNLEKRIFEGSAETCQERMDPSPSPGSSESQLISDMVDNMEKRILEDRAKTLQERMDRSLLFYSNIIAKLTNIGKGLDSCIHRYKENKKVAQFLEGLRIYDDQIQYDDHEFQEDIDKVFKSEATIDESAACAGSLQDAIQSYVRESDPDIEDSNTICGRYKNITQKLNERAIEYSTLYKGISSSETCNLSCGKAYLSALQLNADNYRKDWALRIMYIEFILKLLREYVVRRFKNCKKDNYVLYHIAHFPSNDVEKQNKLNNQALYKSAFNWIIQIQVKGLELDEYCKNNINKKIERMDQRVCFSPKNCEEPNIIMERTNSLIKLGSEVIHSLLKVIFEVQCIKTEADLILLRA